MFCLMAEPLDYNIIVKTYYIHGKTEINKNILLDDDMDLEY